MRMRVNFSCGRCRKSGSAVVEGQPPLSDLKTILADRHRAASKDCEAQGPSITVHDMILVRDPNPTVRL